MTFHESKTIRQDRKMPGWIHRRAARAVVLGCALAGCAGVPSAVAAPPSDETVERAAKAHGKSESEVRRILSDDGARVHASGRIYYVDRARRFDTLGPQVQAGPYPYAQTFTLHSRPGANRVIYLDFDGETIGGTAWNGSFGTSSSFYAEPFSTDATPSSFSDAEQDIIQSVWQRVAEDYAPFDVDVTTQDPGAAAITRSGDADTVYGTRVLITDATEIKDTCGCGGIAYLGVFDEPNSHAYYQPAFVFAEAMLDNAKYIAEAASHEVGHNFDLSHDGTSTVGYYQGHGAWAPIMGVGYYRPITQWSTGEYTGANNTQDDLAIIAGNGGASMADDAGDTTATAVNLGNGPEASYAGLISTDADVDMLEINAGAGPATITVNPAPNSPNLDVQLELLDSAGTVIATSNPASAMSTADLATGMNASLSVSLPSAGAYYLAVDGVGALAPTNTGYSGYASLGRYTLSASYTAHSTVANDNFAAAEVISGTWGTTTGTTVGATRETGEPTHGGAGGAHSIWFSYTAPKTGTLMVDTFGSTFDTLLGGYTGTAVSALTLKRNNDDVVVSGSWSLQSFISFAVTEGTVYHIAVDGAGGASGDVTLNWNWSLP